MNSTFSIITGIDIKSLNKLEALTMKALDYEFSIDSNIWIDFIKIIRCWARKPDELAALDELVDCSQFLWRGDEDFSEPAAAPPVVRSIEDKHSAHYSSSSSLASACCPSQSSNGDPYWEGFFSRVPAGAGTTFTVPPASCIWPS
jgi:hypothetical protein